ncbi:helix-turn-helix domain-containing protein [Janthinobacterium sp. SUN128]|uniref:Helix-turn-helix domain-containing protein n=1 Tax=Janthinobacterium lividum TaxID=29581 RepID=A0AAJ4T4A0_9BURK|nr:MULTISPECIES: RodZ domain-containing protein [Janthinobacterium]KAB0326159.1 helix-turn-helix domain-containing protein [Janthinobacterium lividum]MDO8034441.1 helix-turn-helix domain-containing protein [Janthinobacterium sp. SUN128]QSX95286.1 helix-turn-helix domain-containing protein [Janthinobacterium lividum]UGQ35117.1 helix-turn-helix domain-containing protein [Janthinobacterium sp. PLB04]
MNSEWAETPQQQPQGNLALAGAQLKAQREALGWPVEQVADQLKLAPRQVIALEEGDMAALPNLAVVRGFVRAYAKVVRLDAAPLVAMIEVHPAPAQQDPAAPVRREISATFSESRFPSMTQRSSNQTPLWIAGAVAVVVAAAFGAYKLGYVPASLLSSQAGKETAHAEVGPVETTLIKPGQDLTPVQSPSVPLISVPPPPGNDTQTGAPAAVASAPAAAVVPPAAVPAPAPAATAAATPPAAAAAVGANALVLKVEQDSWVEIRRPGSTPLISRMVKAGSTETFDITGPATLVVGKPGVVQATLRGAKLDLPTVAGGTISRVSIK